jgi:putative transposase
MEMAILKTCLLFLRAILVPKARLAVENLAFRQQLAVCKQSVNRPNLRPPDRIFWVWLSRVWSKWRSALVIVQPRK